MNKEQQVKLLRELIAKIESGTGEISVWTEEFYGANRKIRFTAFTIGPWVSHVEESNPHRFAKDVAIQMGAWEKGKYFVAAELDEGQALHKVLPQEYIKASMGKTAKTVEAFFEKSEATDCGLAPEEKKVNFREFL